MPSKGGPNIITDGLVFAVDAADKNSYPGSGTTWTDLAGSDNGTLTNGPTFDSGNGGSIDFDGSDDYVSTTFDATGGINVTFCFWVKIDVFSDGGYIVDQSTGATGFGIRTITSGDIQTFARNSNNTSVNSVFPLDGLLSTNTWYNMCFKYTTNQQKSYLNGVLVSTDTITLDTISVDSTNNMVIGSRNDAADGYFNGKISYIQIYNNALTDAEITQNYNALKGRFGL